MNPLVPTTPSLEAIVAEPAQATALPLAVTAALLARCAVAHGALVARLLTLLAEGAALEERDQETNRLLTAEEASVMLGVTPRWLYRHARRLPFARRLSRKVLRFSEVGVRRYLETRRG
jgi:predicted DNA-binding transcriptional regulator AlpA